MAKWSCSAPTRPTSCRKLIRARNPALFDYSLAIAIPLYAFLVAGLVGILIGGIIRFLYGRPLETLLATWDSR